MVSESHKFRRLPLIEGEQRVTREAQLKSIEENCDAFKKTLLAKASKIPPNGDNMEIRQWVMDCAKDAWVSKMDRQDADEPLSDGEAALWAIVACGPHGES